MTIAAELLALLPDTTRAELASNGGRLCLSGAARGADALWGKLAREVGHAVVHWSFAGHHRHAAPDDIVILSGEQLAAADPHLERAARMLQRRWPPRPPYALNLLRRDYFQAAWSGSLYAVAPLDQAGRIKGGTAWATQIFIERFQGASCPAFLFDTDEELWMRWDGAAWTPQPVVPAPTNVWTAIGSRELAQSGAEAIEKLLGSGDQIRLTAR